MIAFRLFPFIFLSLFLCCARQEPPSGGPEDAIPPQIIDHLPRSLATRIPRESKLQVFFTEPMDPMSVKESIFISPPLSYKASWRGQILNLSLSVPLELRCTYVVTLGTGCRDLHQNPLPQAYTFAFSTGDSIDRGSIGGITFFRREPLEGASIWAYRSNGDSIHLDASPDYITQSGMGGHFRFDFLTSGNYLVFALLDKNRDRKWDPLAEPLAVPPGRVALTAEKRSIEGFYLSLALRDTTKPNLVSLQSIDCEKVRLVFNHEMDTLQIFNPANFFFSYVGGLLPLKAVYPEYERLDRIYLFTGRQEGGKEYTLRMKGIGDRWGNLLDSQGTQVDFVGSSLPDTVPPSLVGIYPPDGTKAISLGAKVELFFSEPISRESVEEAFSLLDMEDNAIAGDFSWSFPNLCCYIPEETLPGLASLQIILRGDKVKDLAGNRLSDSTLSFSFSTLNPDTLGSISGRITLCDTALQGVVFLTCENVDSRINYVKPLKEPGTYILDSLICGRYILRAWLDGNFNHRFDRGRVFPYSPTEFFTVYPDTVRIRARWETEGLNMELGLRNEF